MIQQDKRALKQTMIQKRLSSSTIQMVFENIENSVNTLCDKSSCSMCTAYKQVAVTRCLFGAQTANLEEWECELVLMKALSLVYSYFVAAICHRRVHTSCDNVATAHFVAALCRINSNQFEFVQRVATTKFCHSDIVCRMSRRLVCPDLIIIIIKV